MVNLEDVRSKDYQRNVDREGWGTDGKDNCLICGRIIQDTPHWIRMTVFGELAGPDAVIHECDDQGCFPIGRSCLRKHPQLRELAS